MVQTETVQARQKNDRFSLVMVDIDFFKSLNSLWGRQVGDYVQEKVAVLIKRNLLAGDNVVRYRGEEFLILLPETGGRKALQVAEMIRRAVEKAKWPNGMSVTVSAGVASYPDDGERLTELLKNVERALSRAKSGGRNQVRRAVGQAIRSQRHEGVLVIDRNKVLMRLTRKNN